LLVLLKSYLSRASGRTAISNIAKGKVKDVFRESDIHINAKRVYDLDPIHKGKGEGCILESNGHVDVHPTYTFPHTTFPHYCVVAHHAAPTVRASFN
jgi:hypothetical protein